jgi:hypothetical protein
MPSEQAGTTPAPPTEKKEEPTMGFWDDPSVRPESNSYKKFESVGDTVSGKIAKLQKRVFNAGTADERTAPEFIFVDEDTPTMTAGQVLLQQALFELRPGIGDDLTVTLAAIEKKGTKTLKRWKVELVRQDGEKQQIDQTVNA